MYDLAELERKWLLYKKKERRKRVYFYSIIGSVFLLVIFVGLFVSVKDRLLGEKNATKTLAEIGTVFKNEKSTKSATPQQDVITLAIYDDGNEEVVKKERPKTVLLEQTKVAKIPTVEPVKLAVLESEPSPIEKQLAKNSNITIETQKADMTTLLESRFSQRGDFQTALLLSKEYYKKGEYEKSLKWAIKANGIDSKNDESWILFSKSSAKLGKRQDAINALENFNRTSATSESKTLLIKIKNGEF